VSKICKKCGKEMPDGSLAYEVKIQVYADFDGVLPEAGTAEEVVAHSRLSTWAVSGAGLAQLARELRSEAAVAMVVPFGNTLHVSGADAGALERVVAAYRLRPGVEWHRAEPGLGGCRGIMTSV